jgi:hypothetical protein
VKPHHSNPPRPSLLTQMLWSDGIQLEYEALVDVDSAIGLGSSHVRRYPHPSYPLTLNPARVSGTRLRARVDCRIRRGLLSRSRILGMVCRPHALSSHCGDLLFSTWMKDRFTDDIQTRQYRYPEGIQGAKWGTSVDIWSVACVVSPVPTPLPIGLLLTILCSRFSS